MIDHKSTIIPLDHKVELSPQPLIRDILRTRHCVPNSIFLVEAVEPDIVAGRSHRTVRLLLGDGELCIQALLAPELHGFVDGGYVYAGCYVRVAAFEAHWFDVAPPAGSRERPQGSGSATAKARSRSGPAGKAVYLLVEDLVTVGRNSAYIQILKENPLPASGHYGGHEHMSDEGRPPETQRTGPRLDVDDESKKSVLEQGCRSRHDPSPSKKATSNTLPTSAKDHVPEGILDDFDDDDFESMVVQNDSATQGQRRLDTESTNKSEVGGNGRNRPSSPMAKTDHNTVALSLEPLKLTPLSGIPTLPFRQNWRVNVLAVVASISPSVEPAYLPPSYKQRTARLAHPSTRKQVLLNVFLDPEDFSPAVGSVVLLIGVKNHAFDGGSLKKYPSDRPKDGRPWWLENPRDLAWCDVKGLKAWWDGRSTD
jgi:hypothetical protein